MPDLVKIRRREAQIKAEDMHVEEQIERSREDKEAEKRG